MCKILIISLLFYCQTKACNNYFQYIRGENGGTEGLITFKPQKVPEHNLKVILTVAAKLPSRYVGDVNLYRGTQASIEDLQNGNPLLYRVRFPINNPLPKIYKIIVNNSPLCQGEEESPYAQYVSTITLTHKFWTTLRFDNQYINIPSYTDTRFQTSPAPVVQYFQVQQQPTTVAHRFVVTQPPTLQPSYQTTQRTISKNSYQCGIREKSRTGVGLILGGKKATKNDFPWLVAHKVQGKFICGGSLVSTKIVVTAAHCVLNKGENAQISEYDSTYYMGKFNLTDQYEEGYVSSGVLKFIVHPDWDHQRESYDSDIAIAVLQQTIIFTRRIKPICLWTNNHGHNDLVKRSIRGHIAGWGISDDNKVSDIPMYINLPVVDDNECLESNSAFSSITSRKTMCVGARTEQAPCAGDSGGAFAVEENGRFFLRGLVSAAINSNFAVCTAKEYTVFTDVSYFTDWINHHINQFER